MDVGGEVEVDDEDGMEKWTRLPALEETTGSKLRS